MAFSLSAASRKNMTGVHPDLRQIIEGAIVLSAVDFGIAAQAVRTPAEQNALFRAGRSQKDGYKAVSNHQPRADGWGHAVDLTPYVGGRYIITDEAWEHYPKIASAMSTAAKALGWAARLKWGCNWTETMDRYGSSAADMTAAMERYKVTHAGPDFLDGPHFELS